ncbi:hypothetical protein AAIE15_23060, partial [Enterobacter hormaechei]|uniref:hypothetical protein n=1 Tax=Enterobacter hormaechei TaxID=158836 RepID=UPI003F456377
KLESLPIFVSEDYDVKEWFLEKMKGATVTNNRRRIARHCSHFKTEALLSWREVGMEFLITTGIVIKDCQPERNDH